MDAVAVWSRRLAEHLTPAEAASAERVGAAYLAGGRRRRDLMRSTAAEPGGFGGGGAGELPFILDGLRVVSGDLLALLAEHPLANLLLLLAMRRAAHPAGRTPPPGAAPPPGGGSPAGDGSPPPAVPALDQAIGTLRDRLRAQGIAPARAEELTYDTLKLVFQQDRGTAEIEAFLRALAGGPPAGLPAVPQGGELRPATGGESAGWLLPPWLWLYFLGVLAPAVPQAVERAQDDIDGMALLLGQLAAGVRHAGVAILTAGGLLEFLPAVILLSGLLGVLFPGVRGRWAERRHWLRPSDEPVLGEMTAFVRRHAPAAGLRLGERHDRLARVYPVGWREARVAVYPPLVRLWQEDREAAQAVLLHEVAHLRQGDHLIVGLASPFAWFVRVWGVALAVLSLIPVTIYLLVDGEGATALLGHALYVTVAVPIGLILPVAGLWVAELSADRYAMSVAGPAALARALGAGRLSADRGRGPRRGVLGPPGRVLGLLSHPPRRLRLWAVRAWPGGTVALAALWPLAYVVRLTVITVYEVIARTLNGSPFPEALAATLTGLPEELASVQSVLLEMAVLLVNWPLLAPLWLRIWTPLRAVRHRFAPYLVSALVPGVLVAGSLPAGDPPALPQADPRPTPALTGEPAPSAAPQAVPERTGLIDDRPWAGQELPVHLRLQPASITMRQYGGDPSWKGTAVGWLLSGVCRAERDGRFTFSTMMDKPDLKPGTGYWLRIGDKVEFWLPITRIMGEEQVAMELLGSIDLGRVPPAMEASWVRKLDGSTADLLSGSTVTFTAALDVYPVS